MYDYESLNINLESKLTDRLRITLHDLKVMVYVVTTVFFMGRFLSDPVFSWEGFCPPPMKMTGGFLSGRVFVRIPVSMKIFFVEQYMLLMYEN